MQWVLILLINFQIPIFETHESRDQCRARIEELRRDTSCTNCKKRVVIICVRPDAIIQVDKDE